MNNDWKQIVLDEEKIQSEYNHLKQEEQEKLEKEIEILKNSLPEIKEKIKDIREFFSNYTITADEPFFDGRKDSYAQIKWIVRFYEGKSDTFSVVHFKKGLIGYSYVQDTKFYTSQEFKEQNQDTGVYWISGDRPLSQAKSSLSQAKSFDSFEGMWEAFINQFKKFISDSNKATSYSYKKDLKFENERKEDEKKLKVKQKKYFNWFFAFVFFMWAFAYTINATRDFTFYPLGYYNPYLLPQDLPKFEISSSFSLHPIFSIFIIYYIIIFFIFFKRAIRDNNQKVSFKLPIRLFILNLFVVLLSRIALYKIYGYDLNSAIQNIFFSSY